VLYESGWAYLDTRSAFECDESGKVGGAGGWVGGWVGGCGVEGRLAGVQPAIQKHTNTRTHARTHARTHHTHARTPPNALQPKNSVNVPFVTIKRVYDPEAQARVIKKEPNPDFVKQARPVAPAWGRAGGCWGMRGRAGPPALRARGAPEGASPPSKLRP
jgi:hypothetical protein